MAKEVPGRSASARTPASPGRWSSLWEMLRASALSEPDSIDLLTEVAKTHGMA